MANTIYNEVQTAESKSEVEETRTYKMEWLPFLRQMYIVSGVWFIYFSLGLSFGAPTVLIAQMRRDANSTEAVSLEMESWLCMTNFMFSTTFFVKQEDELDALLMVRDYLPIISTIFYHYCKILASIHGYASLPFVFLSPISAQQYGRKAPFIFICLSSVAANIVFYCSTSTMHILISEMLNGVILGSNITLLIPIASEYTSPHYRGMLLTIKATLFFWGIWIANIVGTFFHWKNIGLIGLASSVYCLSSIFWPQSPPWLAMKGRYAEAAAIHHWLKGYDDESERELENLIKSQKEYRRTLINRTTKSTRDTLKLIMGTITTRGYYYPLLLTIATMSLYHFSGKLVCMMYALQIIHQITNDEETAFIGMLLLEGITIVGMSFGCFTSRYLKRKTQLLGSTTVAIVFLYIITSYLYLIHLGYFFENKIASLVLLSLFSIFISCGPYMIASPLFGEIISMQYRCSTLLILTAYSELLMSTVLKLAPSIFRVFSTYGAFLFYSIFATMFTVLLFVYLPETKGKSLQEIEDFFMTRRPLNCRNVTKNVISAKL